MKNDELYEVELEFNKDELTEEELTSYLKEEFDDKDIVSRNGHNVKALFLIPFDKYSDSHDELMYYIGDVLQGGAYGVSKGYVRVK